MDFAQIVNASSDDYSASPARISHDWNRCWRPPAASGRRFGFCRLASDAGENCEASFNREGSDSRREIAADEAVRSQRCRCRQVRRGRTEPGQTSRDGFEGRRNNIGRNEAREICWSGTGKKTTDRAGDGHGFEG